MNKLLLALSILGASGGAFFTLRRSATGLQQDATAAREAWLAETQQIAGAQSERSGLVEHIGELKQALMHSQAAADNPLWRALQTNSLGQLKPELREHLFEELGFDWRSSGESIVVSKAAVRELRIKAVQKDKLTDVMATVLAMTPAERDQVEAAVQRVRADYADWALAHVQRGEPGEDVVADYTLPNDPAMSISNHFVTGLFDAVGHERAELILASARNWMMNIGILDEKPRTLIVTRDLSGSEPRLRYQTHLNSRNSSELWQGFRFPEAFRPIFPKGWADVAERENFALPQDAPEEHH